ncbi:MAG: signal recognition particle protein Srp54 [Candidatus Thermoplasmatota archaeon]|nr:signal recognition particle protein Srp54 [Candidatus Thermoplasmatota archaeon]
MVLDSLGDSLRDTLSKIARAGRIDEDLVKEIVRDIQRALLKADVNVKLALQLTRSIQERALNESPPAGASPREHVVKIVYEELVEVLGEHRELPLKKQTIMLVGLYGQGKTTTAGKLAKHFQKKGLRVGLIAADVHRPAAYDQLKQISEQVKAPFYGDPDAGAGDAPRVVQEGLDFLEDKVDVRIVDTSGRHSLDDELVEEMKEVFDVADPDEKLLVIDATVGQQAGPQAKTFNEAVDVSGVVLTKVDGSAKGGGALSAVSETGSPIVFIGVGEGMNDLESFDPARFISRLLGMGDIQTLLEKAQEAVGDKEGAEETAKKILSGKFTLVELREQMDMLSNMGPLSKIADMIPGIGGMKQQLPKGHLEQSQQQMSGFKVIMDSMTEEEMMNPDLIKGQRLQRIATGAGKDPKEVKQLLKYYQMSKRAIKGFSGNRKMQKRLMQKIDFGDLPDDFQM